MSDEDIMRAIVAAVHEEIDPSLPVRPDMTASDVPGWDSLAHVRIMFNVETRLDRAINIDDTYRTVTIGDLIPIFREAGKG